MANFINELKPQNKYYQIVENKRKEVEAIDLPDEYTIYARNNSCAPLAVSFEEDAYGDYTNKINSEIRKIFASDLNFFNCGSIK